MLTPKQHGFRNKHSCLTNLVITRSSWTAAQGSSLSVSVMSIDFRRLYGKVSHLGLIHLPMRVSTNVAFLLMNSEY